MKVACAAGLQSAPFRRVPRQTPPFGLPMALDFVTKRLRIGQWLAKHALERWLAAGAGPLRHLPAKPSLVCGEPTSRPAEGGGKT